MTSTSTSSYSASGDSFTDKISLDVDDDRIPCCICSKQGLRKSDEISLNCIMNFDRKTSFFAMYIGHGGAHVADYACAKLQSLIKNGFYRDYDFNRVITNAFLDFDMSLLEPSVVDEMISIGKKLHESEVVGVVSTSSTGVKVTSINDESKATDKLIAETSETDHGTSDNNYEDNDKKAKEKEKIEKIGKDSGCTAIVALLIKRKLVVANAGDSRCVVSVNGKAFEMSKDHRPTDVLEFKRIYEAGGNVSSDGRVNGILKFSRGLGLHNYKKNADRSSLDQVITALPDIKYFDLKSKRADFIVLACDGIWNTLSSQEVVDFISGRINKPNIKLSSICEELIDKCMSLQAFFKENNDNMACIIVKVNQKKNTGPICNNED